ncbi:putative bifunctional diguanylate cyclase/phosphodiesterase [Rubrobacter calidifluminis]|uniref:putative bifunctional diguanylate cyclase/phosphodiesterase n=1 Tax=Rubrobacter calidifluminis TaxID=1392640 RepID=UPI0023629BF0|nr:EAL domain-containing protein [Rubrobacter calidifluminis]
MASGGRQEGERYRAIFERLADVALVVEPESGRILAANARARELYGISGAGAGISQISGQPSVERGQLLRALRGPVWYETAHRGAGGGEVAVRVSAGPVDWDGARSVVCTVREDSGCGIDAALQGVVREVGVGRRALSRAIPGVVFYVDDAEGLEPLPYMSPCVEGLLGFSPEEWLADGNLFLKILHPEDRERVLTTAVRARMAREPLEMEYRMISRDGRVIWVRDASAPVEEEGRVRWWGVMIDITGLKLAGEGERGEALHDDLTGLLRRELLLELISRALARCPEDGALPAVLYLDLDGFRLARDALGEEGARELIRATGRRISSSLRDRDSAARTGDDEFAVLLEGVRDAAGAARFTRELERKLRRPLEIGGTDVLVSASIGISLGRTGAAPEELLLEAETAASRIRDRGGAGCGFFEMEEEVRAFGQLRLEADLRRALECGGVELLFRPRVSLRGGTPRLIGAEALPSWEHPERGRIPPAELFEIAGETGLEEQLRRMVLREACHRALAWSEAVAGDAISVGVALSERMVPALVGLLARLLPEGGTDPRALVLQISEGALMGAPEGMERSLDHLKRLGVRLELCDFGAFGVSISHLCRLPVDSVKIHRSLLAGLGSDPASRVAVGSAVTLARSLGFEPVADGVERDAQVETLLELGCTTMQGSRFAGLLPGWRLDDLLSARGGC